ncbi:MAG: nuclear transport factor 2 family protein [Hyphomonadaceae bacterium]|nr:nuclear transport factor 2 family protein [Hyphomonadaceae bacterium]
MSPNEIVDAQYAAYNAGDAELLASFYAADVEITDLAGNLTLKGREAFQARFAKTFAEFPQNRAWSKNRIVLGNIVVDHEEGERAPGGERFEVVAIYTIKDGHIARLAMGKGDQEPR